MKKIRLLFLMISILSVENLYAQGVPAFPGAEGCGIYTTGGRGGRVYYVTNLNDDGVGSLRWAIGRSGARVIVFKVSGIIELESRLTISNGDLTIAGQTAPGDGICIKNYALLINADNVIVRYFRSRLGDQKKAEDDAMWGRDRSNIIIDHCTMSWSVDECSSFYGNRNSTMQWCVIAESLQNSVHSKGAHSAGGIWGGKSVSFHHNILAHHNTRNPRFAGSTVSNDPIAEKLDFRNNVIYNWIDNSGYGGEGGSYNIVNNYYKYGPGTLSGVRYRIFQPWGDAGTGNQVKGVYGQFYVNGNYVYGSTSVTTNNWEGILPDFTNLSISDKELMKSTTEFASMPVSTHTPAVAYERVLSFAGASLKRDTVDLRIVKEIRQGICTYTGSKSRIPGLIDTPSDVGGWPAYKQGAVSDDTDADGIPDSWEINHDLNPNVLSDGAALAKGQGGYTNLDVYLASLVDSITTNQVDGAINPVSVLLFTQPDNGSILVTNNNSLVTCGTIGLGTELIITATPNNGYSLYSLKVNGVEFISGSNYTVTGNVTIEATMETINAQKIIKDDKDFDMFPTIVRDALMLYYSTSSMAEIKIFTVAGTLVKTYQVMNSTIKIDLNSLKPGIYFLQSTKDNCVVNKRFVKI
jgi:hypothetical protein